MAVKYLTATLPNISAWHKARLPALLYHSKANSLFATGILLYIYCNGSGLNRNIATKPYWEVSL